MDPFRIFVSFLSLLCFYSVPCSLVTCWEKADLLALVCVVFLSLYLLMFPVRYGT